MESMETLKNKNIIVTGGAGFIGSHLVEALISLGAKVFVIDILIQPSSYFTTKKLNKKAMVEVQDIAQKSKIKKLFDRIQPEYVFHLAAEAIVNDSYHNPYKTFKTNVMGTVSILEAARKTQSVKGVIVASSDKAYGKTKESYTEGSQLKGDHPYDVSKSATDLIAQTYYSTYGLPVTITRFGNVYGEGDLHFNRIIPGICEAIIKKQILPIRSDGTFVRDYLYVKDVVAGYLFLLQNIEKAKGEAYNFSSQDTLSVIDLIKQAEQILQMEVHYTIKNNAKNEIPYQHLDDTKVKKLGWKNMYTMENVLPEILKWYKKIIV